MTHLTSGVNFAIDLDSRGFVAPQNPLAASAWTRQVTSFSARRREAFPLVIQYAQQGVLTDIPFTASLLATIKKLNDYAGTAIANSLTFTKTGTGASAVYSSAITLYTSAIEALFAPSGGVEPSTVQAMLEIQWWNADQRLISQALPLTITNCVYRDTDTSPETLSPAPVPITLGTVTTGDPGTSASVTNSGTSSAAVLNFAIPKGDTGATGATGATGPSGAPTITDISITADTTINPPSGTPTDGERVIFRVTQDSTGGHAVTLSSSFGLASSLTAPTFGTTASKMHLVGLFYSAPQSKWLVVSFEGEF